MSVLAIGGVAVGLVLLIAVIRARNGLVARRTTVEEARAQVDVQLRRRHDLVPQLVNAVRGYLQHERALLERLAQLRSAAMVVRGQPPDRVAPAENDLSRALGRLEVLVEQHPAMRGSEAVLRLQEDLVSTENRIAFARQFHNDSVMLYNTARQEFPRVLVALLFGFRSAEYLHLELPNSP